MDSELPENGQHVEGASWGEEGYGGEEIQHSDQQSQDPAFSLDAANGDQEDAGEYDPESVSYDPASVSITPVPQITESQSPTVPNPPASAKPKSGKPKTKGGFLVGDSDDEEEDASTPASSTVAAPAAVAHNPSPLHASIPAQNAPAEQLHEAVPVRGPSAAPASAVAPAPAPAPVPTPVPAAQAAQSVQTRDPNDTIGILEDRVKEDPRGDMDAWLSLIAEHRRNDQLDELRGVYDRFVQVFPQAVSRTSMKETLVLKSCRPKFGHNGPSSS